MPNRALSTFSSCIHKALQSLTKLMQAGDIDDIRK